MPSITFKCTLEPTHFKNLWFLSDTLAFSVDGVELGVARPEEHGGLLRGEDNYGDDPWSQGSKIAPFDKEVAIVSVFCQLYAA